MFVLELCHTLKIQNRNPRNLFKFCCKALRPYLIYFDFSALFANLNKLLSHQNKSKEKLVCVHSRCLCIVLLLVVQFEFEFFKFEFN